MLYTTAQTDAAGAQDLGGVHGLRMEPLQPIPLRQAKFDAERRGREGQEGAQERNYKEEAFSSRFREGQRL